MNRERSERVTDQQKVIFIDFMESHPDFGKGKLSGTEGREKWAGLWAVLSTQLNSVGGPIKSTAKWQRVWTDLKNKIKRKASEIAASRRRTGGRLPSLQQKLTPFEDRLIMLMSKEAVYGLVDSDSAILELEAQLPLSTDSRVASTSITSSNTTYHFIDVNSIDEEVSEDCTTPSATSDQEDVDDTEPIETPSKKKLHGSKRKRSAAANAVDDFKIFANELNQKVDRLIEISEDVLEERRNTNNILRELVDVIKNK